MGTVIDMESARLSLHILAKRERQPEPIEVMDVPPAKIQYLLTFLSTAELLRISIRMPKGAKHDT